MKARHIKKLRKQIAAFHHYEVSTAGWRMFGAMGHAPREVSARDQLHAIERYMRYRFRHEKQKCEYDYGRWYETNAKWCKIAVIDEKGYTFFYR